MITVEWGWIARMNKRICLRLIYSNATWTAACIRGRQPVRCFRVVLLPAGATCLSEPRDSPVVFSASFVVSEFSSSALVRERVGAETRILSKKRKMESQTFTSYLDYAD